METERAVEVEVLSEEESWDIFVEKVGSSVLVDVKIQKIAKECDGLPLALVTVGATLRNVNKEKHGQIALMALGGFAANVEGMEDKVFSRLRFSYDRLKDDATRSCFLYSALYPEDCDIYTKQLIEYWMWEGLLGDEGRIKDQICEGEMILNYLKDSCLLENAGEFRGFEYVKMHDMIRDMALEITKTSPRCMIRAGVGLDYPPLEEEWIVDVERISLMCNKLKFLQGNPMCPKLSSLLLQNNSFASGNIPHSFFSHMYSVKVIDMSHTDIKFLPDSISNLRNLRALLLSWCRELSSLPSLAMLHALRVLDLSGTKITALPEGMEMLCNLRQLNLSGATYLTMFPARFLKKLTLLEELFTSGTRIKGELEFVDELINSKSIVVLEEYFETPRIFEKYVRSGNWNILRSFEFYVHDSISIFLPNWDRDLGKNGVHINGNLLIDGAPILLPDTTTKLKLERCDDINRLSIYISSALRLKMCSVEGCDQMECVIFSGENKFNSLEMLKLSNLRNLRTICKGVVAPGPFASLKIMDIYDCRCLKSVLTPGLCQCLGNLEQLSVVAFSQMNVIIEDEALALNCEASVNITATINFPKLQQSKLNCLQQLEGIYSGEIVCDSLQTIHICGCEKLINRLPIGFLVKYELQRPLITPPVLTIEVEEEWWDSLELDNPEAKIVLQQTTKFDWWLRIEDLLSSTVEWLR